MVVLLKNRCLVKVSGDDCETFLQSQFSNDIRKIDGSNAQINAYCQHQGKIIAIIWVIKNKNNYYISFPSELKKTILDKFNMFRLMSSVNFEDVSLFEKQYGLIDTKKDKSIKIKNNLRLLITKDLLDNLSDFCFWEKACINNKLPEIYSSTSEKYTPQALNLDIEEIGVSFTKGCYPGQEVVARMHYLGKSKRRLFHFISKFEVLVGDSLDVENSKSLKSSGQVIRVANEGGEFHFLGVFELSHIYNQIFLNNDRNKLVKLIHE